MSTRKNLGTLVSGYDVPDGRNWETVVGQAGKPYLDREFNLSQDIDGGAAQQSLRLNMPSGWLAEDFVNTSSATSGIFTSTPDQPNIVQSPALRAHVNGWPLLITNSGANADGVQSGAAASVGSISAPYVTLTGLTGMDPTLIGTSITISGAASSANNGTFVISGYVSATSVIIVNLAGVTPDANNGSIAWSASVPMWASGPNFINLGAGPVAGQRVDLVVLEVWRRLISPAPDTDGKSVLGRIWQNGNVATNSLADDTLNYPDDIKDTVLNSETTKRVQIQYRLRVITDVDVLTYPYGIDDPSVLANTVPASPASPDGTASTYPYVNQSANGDAGLWVAGDGDPANSLGTVDGYMYALPLMVVFRRNTAAFDRNTNQNGGVVYPGPSDRPDSLLSDIIDERDIYDLRQGVNPNGWNYSELLEKMTNAVFDNSLRTEIGSFTDGGGGSSGSTFLVENEIGVWVGNGTTTGDTPGGVLVRAFDNICRRYSDRSILETVTIVIQPPSLPWADYDFVTVSPTNMAVYPYAAFNWSAQAAVDTLFVDVLDVRWGGTSVGKKNIDAMPYVALISGLTSSPISNVTINFSDIATAGLGLTNEPLYVTLLVSYPLGVGLTNVPVEDYGVDSFAWTAPASTPSAAAPTYFSALSDPSIDAPHREAHLEYVTSNVTYAVPADVSDLTALQMPERVDTIVSISGSISGAHTAVVSDSGRGLSSITPILNSSDFVTITYTALRPLPQTGASQIAVYYRSAALQTARADLLGTSLTVIPKVTGPGMFVITAGSGSQDEAYPYPTGYIQTGGVYVGLSNPAYLGESEMSGQVSISVADFNADTGFLRMPIYIPMVANPEALILERDLVDVDIEGRTFFKSVPSGYVPNAYSQDLSVPDRHKNVYPVLAELAQDEPKLGRKGQLVLVLFVRYARLDETNGVFFDSDLNTNNTTASVFRVKGLLLNNHNG